jgi:hypothetical protein
MTKSYHELLREVRDSLTPENWDKNCYYLSNKNNNLYMSVHGAAQRLVNPEVIKALGNDIFPADHRVVAAAAAVGPGAVAATTPRVTILNNNHLSIWKNRPNWVKEDYIFNNKNYGNLNLHFLMGMFGLTYNFECQESTTLDMIQEKLSEAAMWAEENEEFLTKN